MQRGKQLWRDNLLSFMLSQGRVILSAALSWHMEGWLIKSFLLILATWINDVYIMRHEEEIVYNWAQTRAWCHYVWSVLQILKVRVCEAINLYSLQDLDKRREAEFGSVPDIVLLSSRLTM